MDKSVQYYRNSHPVTSQQGVEIDQGALWKRDFNKNFLVLVDEDEYITAQFNKQIFKPETP